MQVKKVKTKHNLVEKSITQLEIIAKKQRNSEQFSVTPLCFIVKSKLRVQNQKTK
jgi:hypothetical protein